MPTPVPPREHTPGFVLLGDQPHIGSQDPLDFDRVVGDLATLILASRASTPFTLGIEAPWGMGKSTLMGRLKARLDEEESIRPVLFNAWTADGGGVLEGLIKTVLNELDASILRRALRNEKLMGGVRIAAGVVGGLVGLGNVVDSVWKQVVDDPRARNELRSLVEQAVAEWRDQQPELATGRLLCVFIDDLDRCSPEGVLEVFEAMKLYLDVPGIVFVVGYDQDIVSDLVLRKKGYSESIKGRDYLEKFIQIVYRIPRAVPDQATDLIDSLLETSGTGDLLGPNERKLVIDRSESNPRRIKRFINRFVLAYGLDGRWHDFKPQSLVRVQLLQMYFQDFAKLLERPSDRDPVEEFLEYRAARALLSRGSLDVEEAKIVEQALDGHGLRLRKDQPIDDPELLQQLEDSVPVDFGPLADRDDFASLVESLAQDDDWRRLWEALAEGTLSQVAATEDADPVEVAKSNGFEGLRVLWADDAMDANSAYVERLIAGGAKLTQVFSDLDLERKLRGGNYNTLISDITRGDDGEAGFKALERLRSMGLAPSWVIFFTGRETEERRRRAKELGAELTTKPAYLMGFLEGLASVEQTAARVSERSPDELRQVLRESGAGSPADGPWEVGPSEVDGSSNSDF